MDMQGAEFFGLGCFHFRPTKLELAAQIGPNGEIIMPTTTKDWIHAVRTGLESIPSLSLVQTFTGDQIALGVTTSNGDLGLSGDELIDDEMRPRNAGVRFVVNIPLRIQNELFPGGYVPDEYPEKFFVQTRYDEHGPATFVGVPASTEPIVQPSRSVAIVREFLKRELKRAEADLELICVGPSPFWANFALVPAKEENVDKEKLFQIERFPSAMTYDSIIIEYSSDMVTSGDILELAVDELSFEAQFYYSCIRASHRHRTRSLAVAAMAEELIDFYRSSGFRAAIRRLLRSGAHARELLLTVIDTKFLYDRDGAHISRTLSEYVSQRLVRFSEKDIQEATGDDFKSTLESAEEIAKLLEGGRKKEFEIFILSTSTLLGAAAGALAAVLAK